jgi:hypothetical protein
MARLRLVFVAAGLLSPLLFVVAQTSSLSRQSPVRVDLPSWVGNGQCSPESPDQSASLTTQTGRNLTFRCPSKGITRCDFSGAEPIDVSLEDVCRSHRIPVRRGQPVDVNVGNELKPVTVAWLDGSSRTGLVTIATRQGLTSPVRVAVDDPDRLLRFTRPGGSPLTVRAGDLSQSGILDLPTVRPGGEIVAYQPAAPVRPFAYQVTAGPLVELRGNWLVASGLTAGAFDLTPIYRGGVHGTPVPVKVEDEVSTYLPLPTQPVGSIEVQIENGLCLEVRDILVDWLDPDKNAKYRRATLQRDAACEFRIDGLEPGRYEVTAAASPERSGGFRQMLATEVGEQAVVRLAFEAPIVRVFGRVSVAKEPPPSNTGIAFDPVAAVGEGQAIVVPVQADGSFEVRLPGPGEYLTRIHTTPIPLVGVGRSFVAKEGYNWFEWLIEGGSLTLDIENWDRSSRIEFQLKRLLTRQPQLGRSPPIRSSNPERSCRSP